MIHKLHLNLLKIGPLYLSKRLFRNTFLKHRHYIKGRVLDIGCGKQPFKHYFDEQDYFGIDVIADNTPHAVATADILPVKANSFDSILCSEVLEHIPVPHKVLQECNRVLKPGGTIYITVPMNWYLHYEPHDYFRFTNYGITYLLKEAGFTVITIEKLGGFILNICLRLADVIHTLLFYVLSPFKLIKIPPARLAAFCLVPFNLAFLVVIALFDRISKREAKGWLAIGTKPIN